MSSSLELLPNTYRAFFSGFPSLTPAQKHLIQPILDGADVILQAGTGSGKTEAVLAPATEKLITYPDYCTIIYIVPTRALALDMNRRIKPIYEKLGLKSGMRTGDGKSSCNAKLHLLITTPESLDVLLGSQNQENKSFLKHIFLMIIDEVHVFLHSDRGHQLSYLHRRLALQSIRPLQTVALSATIDNAEDIERCFQLPKPPFYYKQSTTRKLQPHWAHIQDEGKELPSFFDDLYRQHGCKKILVFANSRKKCEQLYDILSQNSVFFQKSFLHYSNLSTRERKLIETSFRNAKIGVCIATSTLELGIDIGSIDGVVLIEPPSSTMAFLQRIGRGNRRQKHINFWGVCCGQTAGIQLVRFLAFFELAKEHQVEKYFHSENYSVLFQQIVSCLYAKNNLSADSLSLLFKEKAKDLPYIIRHMIANNWIKPSKLAGIYEGSWRYFSSLQRKQIWSNFPPTDEEYDVILDYEKIAVLPLSMVKQLEVGNLIRLVGKVLKVLHIEEKKTACEVWVEESDEIVYKELIWIGFGPLIPFEVARQMELILLDKSIPQGLSGDTQRLLEKEREKIARSFRQPNGIWVHQLENGMYRYETFLGSCANSILYHLIERQCTSTIEGLSVHFDEIGLECNEWIPFASLEIPHTTEQFHTWMVAHLPLLKCGRAWNSWLYSLPEELQGKEIASRLYDPRVLEHFKRYHTEKAWHPLPSGLTQSNEEIQPNSIDLEGDPWSWEDEKSTWEMLSFPIPSSEEPGSSKLTATQVQGYVTQKLCPRWARLQHLAYQIGPHPRFLEVDEEIKSRRQEGISFKKKVIEILQVTARVFFETAGSTWKQAIETVLLDKKPIFLAQAQLTIDGLLHGSPDLIYIRHQGSHICLEVWDIKFSTSISYAQKWRIAFYAYLLDFLLRNEMFSLPVQVSSLGGLVYPSTHQNKQFEKTPFVLTPYTAWMPRLIDQWKTDSKRVSAAGDYSMNSSCSSCHYFSYCYQETLSINETAPQNQAIVSKNIESNDFPKNSKHWYFVYYDTESVRCQCWENGASIYDMYLCLQDFPDEEAFQKEVSNRLHKQWNRSVKQEKNPHFLVYESIDWHSFQRKFSSTELRSLWAMHVPWTSIQTILETHFIWPIDGLITPMQIGACLGLSDRRAPPLSLYHRESFSDSSFDLCRDIWNWCLSHVKSGRMVSFRNSTARSVPLIDAYLAILHRESECHLSEILAFQKNPLPERIQQFRSIGPIRFIGNGESKGSFVFSIENHSIVSKFRAGDFLKISPIGSRRIQEGFSVVLDTYLPQQGLLSLRCLSKKTNFSKSQSYALDEDATDWNTPKIAKVLTLLKDPKFRPEVMQILLGATANFPSDAAHWIRSWYPSKAFAAQLNPLQEQALILPFQKKIGLIEGPPGTGKTHLLVWTLVALVAYAKSLHRPIKILVTAQTHHAIDQILEKVAKTLPAADVSNTSLWKYGRFNETLFPDLGIGHMKDSQTLYDCSCLILGATGYGIYQLLENKNFPALFDWVIFDESSQIQAPYALLSLVFGKGQALFYGDTQQLAPVVKGSYENTFYPPRSILQELISRYSTQNCLRLNETYRMNADICQFASDLWYDSELQSAKASKDQRLELPHYPLFKDSIDDCLDPSQSMVLVQLDHVGSKQSSQEEAQWIAKTVQRLIHNYSLCTEQIGIISPHRLQNNTILAAIKEVLPFSLKLPKVDTVERMQGSEFDIVIFSATVSDTDMIHSHFLKDYRRFNVALTRARKKFIFVASPLFFQSFPRSEKELIEQMPFETFFTLYHDKVRTLEYSGTDHLNALTFPDVLGIILPDVAKC